MRRVAATALVALLATASGCFAPHTFDRCRGDEADWDGGTLCHDGRLRHFLVTVPEGDGPFPLLLALHGGGGDAVNMQHKTGLDVWADAYGVVVLYPEGTPGLRGADLRTWNAAHCCGRAHDDDTDDVGFLDALVDLATANLRVDADRIGATGHSNGGMMAHYWAASSTTPTHIMPVAGAIGGETPPGAALQLPPTPAHAPQVLIIHATDDARVPYHGGQGDNLGAPRRDAGVADAVAFWEAAGSDVDVVTTTGGHGWPGGRADISEVPATPDASRLVVKFLVATA